MVRIGTIENIPAFLSLGSGILNNAAAAADAHEDSERIRWGYDLAELRAKCVYGVGTFK